MRELFQSESCLHQEPCMRSNSFPFIIFLICYLSVPTIENKRAAYALYNTAVASMKENSWKWKSKDDCTVNEDLVKIKPSTFPSLFILALWLSHSFWVPFSLLQHVTTRTKHAFVERSWGKTWSWVLQLSSCHCRHLRINPNVSSIFATAPASWDSRQLLWLSNSVKQV